MISPDELAAARVDRENDNTKVRPADLLRAMAHDIETGVLKVDALLLLYMNRPKGASWDWGSYRCGLTRDQEVVILALAQERTIRNWREGE